MRETLLTAFALLSLYGNAQTTIKLNDISYTSTSPSTVEVSGYGGTSKEVSIPGSIEHEGKQYQVTAIGEGAFSWGNVTSITLPASIDSIKAQAFKTSALNTITLPERLTYIGPYAFNSTKITQISIPSSVKEIASHAFFTCASLTNIEFKEGLKEIGEAAFYGNRALTSVTLPKGLAKIDNTAFANCTSLTEATLPEGLLTIGNGAFNGCGKLLNITIPTTVTAIGDEAFLKCQAMTALNIPKGVESIGTSIIAQTSISSLTVDPANTKFHIQDGALYNTGNTLLYAIPMKGKTELKVADGCIGINGGACWGAELETVTLPKGLLAIDDYAFLYTKISQIDLPNSITFIGEQAFAETYLTEVVIPENVVYIEDGVFANCKQLTTVTIPSSVTTVFNHAFSRCSKLEKVICQGSQAPTIAPFDESYDSPFYEIASSPKLHILKGALASYQQQGWNDPFTIVEQKNGILKVVTTTPQDSSTVNGYGTLSFKITFEEPVQVINQTPDVALRAKSLLHQNIFTPDDSWKVTLENDNKTINVWAADYDGYPSSFKYNPEERYFFVLPANTVKTIFGNPNERIVISLIGDVLAGIETINTTDTHQKIVGRYNLNGQKLDAPQKGINILKFADGTTKKVIVN